MRVSAPLVNVLVSRAKAERAQVLEAGILQILDPAFAQANLEQDVLMACTMQAEIWLTEPQKLLQFSLPPKAINTRSIAQHSTAQHNDAEQICSSRSVQDDRMQNSQYLPNSAASMAAATSE